MKDSRMLCDLAEECSYADISYAQLIWDGEMYRCYARADCTKVTPAGALTGWLHVRLHPFQRLFIARALERIKNSPDPLPELVLTRRNKEYYVKVNDKFVHVNNFVSNWYLLDIKRP